MTTITDKLADALRAVVAYEDDRPGAGTHGLKVYRDAEDAIAAYDAQRAAQAESDADVWRCDDGEFIMKRGTYGPMQVACVDSPEDAARIIACVNACHGMTLADIESFGSPGELGRCAQAWVAEDNDNA